MNSRNMILSGALIALVMLVTTNVFFASSVLASSNALPGAFNPTGQIQVWEVKKDIQVCNQGTSTPQGSDYETGGCVDVMADESYKGPGVDPVYGNATFVRSGSYLFTGETLNYLAVARDLNGAEFLMPTASLQIDGHDKVLCTDISSQEGNLAAGYLYGKPGYIGPAYAYLLWYGHDVSGMLTTLPLQLGKIDLQGFHSQFDKLYTCTYTVTSADVGLASKVSVQISDIKQNLASTLEETWAFNPGISASVSFDSGTSLEFANALPGTPVQSSNSLLIKNTALGGVDLVVFISGNDLVDTSGTALCPTTNVLSINNVGYKCNIGSYISDQFTPIPNVKQSASCGWIDGVLPENVYTWDAVTTGLFKHPAGSNTQCLVPDDWAYSNILIPDNGAAVSDSILHSGAQAQCTFLLNVPFPCMGTFTAPNAVDVLIRAV